MERIRRGAFKILLPFRQGIIAAVLDTGGGLVRHVTKKESRIIGGAPRSEALEETLRVGEFCTNIVQKPTTPKYVSV